MAALCTSHLRTRCAGTLLLEQGDREKKTQGKGFPPDCNTQPEIWHLHLHPPSPVQDSLGEAVGFAWSCQVLPSLGLSFTRAPAIKHLSLGPACATLLSVLRQWKRCTRASLPSSCKELFQSRNITTHSVPCQSVQTEVVKILNKQCITGLATLLSFKSWSLRTLTLSKAVRVRAPFVLKEMSAGNKMQRSSQHWVTTSILSQKL